MELGIEDGHVWIALVGIVLEALQDDAVEQVWYAGIELAGQVGAVVLIELQAA